MNNSKPQSIFSTSFTYLLFIALLVTAAFLRFYGQNWDGDQHLHPDERFLTTVESSIYSSGASGNYFNTETSTLNPANVGHGYFVYGTFPILLTRMMGEWFEQTGYNQIHLIGRALSATADLMVVALVFFVARRLYSEKVALIATTFATFSVLPIQLSHFFAVDTFTNLFIFWALAIAVMIATDPIPIPEIDEFGEVEITKPVFKWSQFFWFGLVIGLGLASKISAAPATLLLPLATLIRLSRLPKKIQQSEIFNMRYLGYLALGGAVCLITFRIFQPYAFMGPNFWNITLNPRWVETMKSVAATARGDIDWPPHIQWARRNILFGWKNISLWGIGLPMAIFTWTGFVWMGWETFRNRWQQHSLIWGWVAFFLVWQSSVSNPTFRYFLPIYPGMTIMAGWTVVKVWQHANLEWNIIKGGLAKLFKGLLKVAVIASILGTLFWALSFHQLYKSPVTRVAASEWIYQNIEGPLTLSIDGENGIIHQPLSVPYRYVISPSSPLFGQFVPKHDGVLSEISLHSAYIPNEDQVIELRITEFNPLDNSLPIIIPTIKTENFISTNEISYDFIVDSPNLLNKDQLYQISIALPALPSISGISKGSVSLTFDDGDIITLPLEFFPNTPTAEGDFSQIVTSFYAKDEFTITGGTLRIAFHIHESITHSNLKLTLSTTPDFSKDNLEDSIALNLMSGKDGNLNFSFPQSIDIQEGETYYYKLETFTEGARISLEGTPILVESPWDDPVPLRISGYDGYGGIYPNNMNVELYNHDNQEKRERMIDLIDRAEYITISSSRQWASTTRIPERYPLNVIYYQNLLGCDSNQTIEYCYNVADVGESGPLGFELVYVAVADIGLGDFKINDQFSEEAFTVYDHPKVFIFQKTDAYDSGFVASLFNQVDLSKVILLTPKQAGEYDPEDIETKSLLLDTEVFDEQRESNTWSDLFDINSWVNSNQVVTVIVWYLAILILGLSLYPIVRLIFPGLNDKGYPLARGLGLLLLAYLAWISSANGSTFSASNIFSIYSALVILGFGIGWRDRAILKEEFAQKKKYLIGIEITFLVFFLFSLLVRLGNPDLWHPSKGGEKPMDFAYFNAVLKSNTFPPYDPWFAGGYINYYYFGFIFIGSLVKMLGIIPSVAYNLAIPTLYALISIQAFSLVWNIFIAGRKPDDENSQTSRVSPWSVSFLGAFFLSTMGNLGSIRMILRGYQKIAAGGDYSLDAGLLTKWGWTLEGIVQGLLGKTMPYSTGNWYWDPSRVIRGVEGTVQPITEFPWFTTIYADLHAHLIALPITLLALSWALSIILNKKLPKKLSSWFGSILIGSIIIGALKPTNTWDIPAYLAIAVIAILYVSIQSYLSSADNQNKISTIIFGGGRAISLVLLSYKILYLPFDKFYAQGYGQVNLWDEFHTNSGDYFIHWGIFLTILTTWLIWETREWLANTPVSAIHKIHKSKSAIYLLMGMAIVFYLALVIFGVRIHWIALPLAIWSAILLFRPHQPAAKKVVLFAIGTALFLTMMVEVVALAGDIGRMNTVFKFYMQAWVLLAISSGATIGWMMEDFDRWKAKWQTIWSLLIGGMIIFGTMFTIWGTAFKIKDRWDPDTPHSLDGMTFMQNVEYHDQDTVFELSQDYAAIQWVQQNIEGTPVIVEAFTGLYKWGSRFSIYTGLPTVVGWDWHQRQQRDFVQPGWVQERVNQTNEFYATSDLSFTTKFLQTYDVDYIIVGQVERGYFPGEGLNKFVEQDGILWKSVYSEDQMTIYQVIKTEGK